jgi:chromosome segregation ATPase
MSQNPIVEETRRKLDELDKKIKAAKAAPGASQEIASDANKDWQDMVQSHAEISRKLDAANDQSAEVLEGIRLDVDVLRHSFERWMARVEGNFAKDTKGDDKP